MSRAFTDKKILIATHNKAKLEEFRELFTPLGIEVTSAGELGLSEPEETGQSFYENAKLKAESAMKESGLPALADDSGFCVSALDDAPGIYSGRWAEENGKRDFQKAMERIQKELGNKEDRRAHFACSLVLVWPDGHEESVEGRSDGEIVWPPRGEKGMGYDPIFQPKGDTRTFAEMDANEKNPQSHRGRALEKLKELFA